MRRVALLLACLAARSQCRRVLVTSFGGSGSTDVMIALRAAGFGTNSKKNTEALKHATATATQRKLGARGGLLCWKNRRDKCFDRVLVVDRADPAKAIVSTVARFGLQHYRRVSKGCAKCPSKFGPKGAGKADVLRSVFSSGGAAGGDLYGAANHFASWAKVDAANAGNASSKWPPLLFADAATLADPEFECAFFSWLGLRDPASRRALVGGLRKHRASTARADPQTLMDDAARAVYGALAARVSSKIAASTAAARRLAGGNCSAPG